MKNTEKIISEGEKAPKVFIIIPNCNGHAFIFATMTEIFRLDYTNFEVVLVDNNSNDGSLEEVRGSFSKVIVIKNSADIGVAGAMNVGIKYALERGAQYVLLLRQGIRGLKNILPALISEMEKDPQIGLDSPLVFENNRKLVLAGGKISWLKMRLEPALDVHKENDFRLDYLPSGTTLIRAEVFRKTGLLNEAYLLSGGETQLGFQAKVAGYKLLLCPMLQVTYLGKSVDTTREAQYTSILATLLFFKNNTPTYLLPWAAIFFGTAWLVNWIELKIFKKEMASMTQRAYYAICCTKPLF